jgi:hypothetical protein
MVKNLSRNDVTAHLFSQNSNEALFPMALRKGGRHRVPQHLDLRESAKSKCGFYKQFILNKYFEFISVLIFFKVKYSIAR